MGWVVMSKRALHRIGILSEVVSGRRSVASAASLLAVSSRHVHRLLGRLEAGGGAALARRARGRPSNNKIQAGIHGYAVTLVWEKMAVLAFSVPQEPAT